VTQSLLPPNIVPPEPMQLIFAVLAIACLVAAGAAFALFWVCDGIAFVMKGQLTVSELLWMFHEWGPASRRLVRGTLVVLGVAYFAGGVLFFWWLWDHVVHLGTRG